MAGALCLILYLVIAEGRGELETVHHELQDAENKVTLFHEVSSNMYLVVDLQHSWCGNFLKVPVQAIKSIICHIIL